VPAMPRLYDSGPMAALRHVLRELQEEARRGFETLRRSGTCGREFMEWLEALEEKARREMMYRGFEPLPEPRVPVRGRRKEDLVLGYFRYGGYVIEIGLRGLNRCGVLEEVSGGEPPRVYAKIYTAGGAAITLEAEEDAEKRAGGRRQAYYIM